MLDFANTNPWCGDEKKLIKDIWIQIRIDTVRFGTPSTSFNLNKFALGCHLRLNLFQVSHHRISSHLTGVPTGVPPASAGGTLADSGMGHSLAAGVCATANAGGWIVALGDMPFIASSSHHAVATCLRNGASLVATQYQGRRGHPVGFSRKWLAQLAAMTGDQGGKDILEKHRENLILCQVDDPGVVQDIDRQEDLMEMVGISRKAE